MKFMLKGTLLRGCCSRCIAYEPVRDVDGDLMCEACAAKYNDDGDGKAINPKSRPSLKMSGASEWVDGKLILTVDDAVLTTTDMPEDKEPLRGLDRESGHLPLADND